VYLYLYIYIVFIVGCRRIENGSGDGNDLCSYRVNEKERPNNKSEAMADEVVGGAVVGTTGTVAATQIGMNN
jgi:hypothetical protein